MHTLIIVHRPPNLCQGRRVQPGQFIHASVIDYMHENSDYVPAADLNNGLTWDDFKSMNLDTPSANKAASLVVPDLYSSAVDIIPALQNFVESSVTTDPEIIRRGTTSLRALASSGL